MVCKAVQQPERFLHGAADEFFHCRDPEAIIAGPAETGKTFAALLKLHVLLSLCPGTQAALVRKVRDTIYGSCLQTYSHRVLRPEFQVRAYGGERPQWFDYPNGSRLWLAGIDDPGKVLSSERDFIYVNQAEELSHDDWQVLTTRATGRAGRAPYGQTFGDCNPGPPHHWIKNRSSLTLFESRHEDNPTLWDAGLGAWTDRGLRTLAILDALTGVRRERLRFGRWVSAEGLVYESFDPRRHVIDPFPIPASWPRVRVIDFGYTNPFVCLWVAFDKDWRAYVYREIYMTGRTVTAHKEQIAELSRGETYLATVADHDAEDRATLAQPHRKLATGEIVPGILTQPAQKAIRRNVQLVEDRLAAAGDGRPRLFLFRNALVERDNALAERRLPVCTEQEFGAYEWPKGSDGKATKEAPVDRDNHGMDCLGYGSAWADIRVRGGGTPTIVLPPAGKRTLA